MKRILSLIICGVLVLGITGCGNNDSISDRNDNSSSNNDNIQENVNNESNNQQSNETYDKIIHCDLETGIQGSRVDEAEGSYYEYYFKDEKLVKYIRFKVLPSEWDEATIKEYLDHMSNEGWKNVKRTGKNVVLTIESAEDAPEDNNPLNGSISSLEEDTSDDPNCYIK
ncbi:MAG: hypothetical protein IJ475_01530 [Bacilli bacterium]|nr:hypothetical protein [Bacilli bacterium]